MNVRYYMLATFIPVLAMSLINTLKFLAPISAISLIFVIYGYIVSVVLSAIDLPDISERRMVSPVEHWPLFVGTVIFAFEGIALVSISRIESIFTSYGTRGTSVCCTYNALL